MIRLPATGAAIIASLRQAFGQETAPGERVTVVLCSHRLAGFPFADLVPVLEQGCVVEAGTHAELLAAGGLARPPATLVQRRHRRDTLAGLEEGVSGAFGGPMFPREIAVRVGDTVSRDGFCFTDLVPDGWWPVPVRRRSQRPRRRAHAERVPREGRSCCG